MFPFPTITDHLWGLSPDYGARCPVVRGRSPLFLGTVPKVWDRRPTGLGTRGCSGQIASYAFRCVRVEQEDHFRILRTRTRRLALGGPERPLLEPYRGADNMCGDPAIRSLHGVSSTRRVVQCTRRRSSGSDRGAVRALRGVDTPLTTTHKDSSSSNPEPRCLKTPQSNLKRRCSRQTGLEGPADLSR